MAKRTTNPHLAVAYLRESTSKQKYSPEVQRQEIEAWALARGVTIIAWHEDRKVSGGTALALRPALTAALQDLRAHRAGTFVAAYRDRLGRDVVEVGLLEREVQRLGAVVRTADGKSDGDALEKDVRDVFSAHEKREIRRRIVAALSVKRSKNEKLGGLVPYGFRLAADGVHLEVNEDENRVLERVRELSQAGLSQRAIARELAVQGFRGRTGAPFQKTQIARMLAA